MQPLHCKTVSPTTSTMLVETLNTAQSVSLLHKNTHLSGNVAEINNLLAEALWIFIHAKCYCSPNASAGNDVTWNWRIVLSVDCVAVSVNLSFISTVNIDWIDQWRSLILNAAQLHSSRCGAGEEGHQKLGEVQYVTSTAAWSRELAVLRRLLWMHLIMSVPMSVCPSVLAYEMRFPT